MPHCGVVGGSLCVLRFGCWQYDTFIMLSCLLLGVHGEVGVFPASVRILATLTKQRAYYTCGRHCTPSWLATCSCRRYNTCSLLHYPIYATTQPHRQQFTLCSVFYDDERHFTKYTQWGGKYRNIAISISICRSRTRSPKLSGDRDSIWWSRSPSPSPSLPWLPLEFHGLTMGNYSSSNEISNGHPISSPLASHWHTMGVPWASHG